MNDRKQINFTIVPDDSTDQPRTYANFCAISHTPFDFTLAFCEVLPLSENDIKAAEAFIARVNDFRAMIEKHTREEETKIFPKLLPRKEDVSMEGVRLKVEAGSVAIPLKVAPDHTFALQVDRAALEKDARVIPNRKAGTMTWRADVRTPGLPPDVRRLGDLRLECEVGMKAGLISNYPRGFFGWLEGLVARNPDYCHRAAPRT